MLLGTLLSAEVMLSTSAAPVVVVVVAILPTGVALPPFSETSHPIHLSKIKAVEKTPRVKIAIKYEFQ